MLGMETSTTPMTSNQPNSSLNMPAAVVIAGLLIAGGVYFGLSQTSPTGTGSSNPVNIVTVAPGQQAAADTAGTEPTTTQVAVGDSPVLGDADAPVTLIEFSDYECPYCQRHFEQTLPSVKENYIDTGKVKYVFRDLPLSFHDPNATTAALAARCARDQGGDATYFRFHDEYFKNTASNGAGVTGGVDSIATTLKLNQSQFKQCVDSKKYQAEVQKDLQDAQAAGATGTPTFFVGKSTEDGVIEGEIVVGALPYASLSPIIDKYLQ